MILDRIRKRCFELSCEIGHQDTSTAIPWRAYFDIDSGERWRHQREGHTEYTVRWPDCYKGTALWKEKVRGDHWFQDRGGSWEGYSGPLPHVYYKYNGGVRKRPHVR